MYYGQVTKMPDDRIDNFRVIIEAGELKRWVETMRYAEDSIVNHGIMPVEFEFDDGAYDYDDIVKILGREAMNHLLPSNVA